MHRQEHYFSVFHISVVCVLVYVCICVCWCVHVCTNLYVVVYELVSTCIWRAEADILFNHYLLYLLKKSSFLEPQLVQRCSVACKHIVVTPCLYFPRRGGQCPLSISVDLKLTRFLFPLSFSRSRASTLCVLIS